METDIIKIRQLIKLDFIRTAKGDEVKGFRVDDRLVYLNSTECRKLAEAFGNLATHLDNSLVR